jgi:hypothetical protein
VYKRQKEQIAKRRPNGEPLGELSGLDWQLAPRAKIFRRDAGKVTDMDGFLQIMRSNAYKTDPYAGTRAPLLILLLAPLKHHTLTPKLHPGNQTYAAGSPWNAICSRGDLAGSPDGCLDGKASMASLWASKTAFAVNGPTTGALYDGPLPPFSWAQFPTTPHDGLFETYNFDFEEMKPTWA